MDNLNLTEKNFEQNNLFISELDIENNQTNNIAQNSQSDETMPESNINSNNIPEQNSQTECTALVVTKPNSLFVAQKMFKKSIKLSIKSFLISLSLGFLNLFI